MDLKRESFRKGIYKKSDFRNKYDSCEKHPLIMSVHQTLTN
jgi:hypothetical protein